MKISISIKQIILSLFMLVIVSLFSIVTQAKTQKTRQVQEVNFAEMNLKGTVRNPDGAYLVQKKGIKFMPLYDVQKSMDGKIRETSLYID